MKHGSNPDFIRVSSVPICGPYACSRAHPRSMSPAWLIEDVKRVDEHFPIGVVVLPPAPETENYQRAIRIFDELRAEVVLEHDLSRWANSMVQRIPPFRK